LYTHAPRHVQVWIKSRNVRELFIYQHKVSAMRNFNYLIVLGIAIVATLLIFALIFSRKKRESFEIGNGQGRAIMGADVPNNNPVKEGNISSAKECQTKCAATNGCTHYTWLGPNTPNFSNTCWLKNKNVGGHVIDWADSFSGTAGESPGVPGKTPGPPGPQQTAAATGNPILDYHNQVRAKHGAGPLVWSPTVADSAQKWANMCLHRHGSSTGANYGQNLAWGHADEVAAAVDWYNEHKVIQASGNDISKGGHFAQMVWKEAAELGCGKAMCDGRSYIVCEYNPPNIAWPWDYHKHVQVDPNP
jgi:uncharacterized protein YkwD